MGVSILRKGSLNLLPPADLFRSRVEGEEICSGPPIF